MSPDIPDITKSGCQDSPGCDRIDHEVTRMLAIPPVKVILFQEGDGTVPLVDWFDRLSQKARVKCVAWLGRLETFGHELQRPDADYLTDGIYELRVGLQGVNYRMLYFFHGTAVVVVSHGLVKERRVPPLEIDKAVERKTRFEQDPIAHAFAVENL